ncbi:MAG: class I SAM-dependent methyltransferase [Pseudomonadota bacterium]
MAEVGADRHTDDRYIAIRAEFGADSALANGYRTQAYFEREQALLLSLIGERSGLVADFACGSGLMGLPLQSAEFEIVGVDFNHSACCAAAKNGIQVVRGDVFRLPFADAVLDLGFACQFFNQQTDQAVSAFIAEASRCLKPAARLFLVWRNHNAWVHRIAHALFSVADGFRKRPRFPLHSHPLDKVKKSCEAHGFVVIDALVSFPTLSWHSRDVDSAVANFIGASLVLVVEKTSA